jgi:protein arginine kinase activator
MMCESCKDNEATIHLTQVVEGAVKKLHLCEDCAAKNGFDIHGPMSITDMLLGLGAHSSEPEKKQPDRTCPRCHMRRADFKKTSRFGCPVCYDTFGAELPPLLRAMHRSEQHAGKVPRREQSRAELNAELATLQGRLEKAVAAEKFEEAASLRDKIQSRRHQLDQE